VTLLRRGAVLAVGSLTVGVVAAGPAGAATSPRASYAAACRSAGSLVADAGGPGVAWTVAARRALPPTPLPDVLAATRTAVVARVAAVVYQGPQPSTPRRPPGFVGPIPPKRCQVVRLAVTQVLRGSPPRVLLAVKPQAPYLLATSRRLHAGTFLLDGRTPFPTILGNYGPSPYAPAEVTAALGATH
jgi:hypothetical protein